VWSGGAGERNQVEQRVAIPVQDVVGLQIKTLDKRRTVYVAVGATAVVATLVARRNGGNVRGDDYESGAGRGDRSSYRGWQLHKELPTGAAKALVRLT
jgi:hypothetical protein